MEITPSWYGVFAPAKTPAAIVGKLHREIKSALGNRGVRQGLAALNVEPDGNPPAEFKSFVAASIKRYAELVRLAGIQPE